MAEARRPSLVYDEKKDFHGESRELSQSSEGGYENEPTMEEMKTLRRVSGKIPWQAYTITFVEFCERFRLVFNSSDFMSEISTDLLRFSWYGTTAVFVNYIQQPRPFGSRTGNIQITPECFAVMGEDQCRQAGALGQGQQASTGLTVCLAYLNYRLHVTDMLCRRSTNSGPTSCLSSVATSRTLTSDDS